MKGDFRRLLRHLSVLYFILFFNVQGNSQKYSLEEQMELYNNKAYDFLVDALYDSSEIYYLKTIKLKETLLGPRSYRVGIAHMNMASLYKILLNYDEALKHYNLAELKPWKDGILENS